MWQRLYHFLWWISWFSREQMCVMANVNVKMWVMCCIVTIKNNIFYILLFFFQINAWIVQYWLNCYWKKICIQCKNLMVWCYINDIPRIRQELVLLGCCDVSHLLAIYTIHTVLFVLAMAPSVVFQTHCLRTVCWLTLPPQLLWPTATQLEPGS